MKKFGVSLSALMIATLAACAQPANHTPATTAPSTPASDAFVTIDDFASADAWKLITSDGVVGKVSAESQCMAGNCLRIDYEFTKGTGYCLVQRPFPVDLGENFEFSYEVWGTGPDNNLEFKLLDPTTQNVWWNVRRAYTWHEVPERVSVKKRNLQFAWGPSGGAPMPKLGFLEFAISSSSGGSGTVHIRNLKFRPLPPNMPYTGTPVVTATSENDPTSRPQNVIDGNQNTAWRPHPGDHKKELTIDFGTPREIGGLKIVWSPGTFPSQVFVNLSDDGTQWRTGRIFGSSRSAPSYIALPEERTRYIQLVIEPGPNQRTLGLAELTVLPTEDGASSNALIRRIAHDSPRGFYPRYFLDEQRYWTVVGAPNAKAEGLLSEDGTLELFKKGYSVEPFIRMEKTLSTWDNSKLTQTLGEGAIPIPTVVRTTDAFQLTITAFAHGTSPDSILFGRYTIKNISKVQQGGDLILMVRPFQVLPPWQALNIEGGVSRIRRLAYGMGTLEIDDRKLFFSKPADQFVVFNFDDGDLTRYFTTPSYSTDLVAPAYNEDSVGLASGGARYRFILEPGEERTISVAFPLERFDRPPTLPPPDRGINGPFSKFVDDHLAAAKTEWTAALNKVSFTVPPEAQPLIDTFRSQLGYVLINRDGPALQPGSRTYERSWARDGSMSSAALLQVGLVDEARAWIDWFGSYQFENGKVPCVVDTRGPDPVPEHDSTGQYIWAVANYYAFTKDAEFLKSHWPRVQKGVEYIQSLRAQRMTPEFAANSTAKRQENGKPAVPASAFFGLVPESISHEGYSAKPMHSFWDDLFTARGLKDAATIAAAVGDAAKATEYAALAKDFRACLVNAYKATAKAHGIDYLAGCVELGDFDSTSTTVALFPCDEGDALPQDLLTNTFEKSWKNFVERRDSVNWKDYTPYELRMVGAYVHLGWADRAQELLKFYMHDQRPKGWNHWAEIVWRDDRAPKFIGDMPHTWVGSDYLNSICAMFAFERGSDQAVVLFAGIPAGWYDKGVGVTGLNTRFGALDVSGSKEGSTYRITIKSGPTVPPGGFVFPLPERGKPAKAAKVNGKYVKVNARGEVPVMSLPATIEVQQ